MSNNIFFFLLLVHIWLLVSVYVCVCLVFLCWVNFFTKPWEENPSVFEKLYVNIVGEKFNICCTPSFHLSLEMMKKTMIFMNNSGDVDDAEADYTCPSWIRAFDVRCIFVGGVVRSGQEKPREGVIPNTSQAHCSSTATYLPPLPPRNTPPGKWLCDTWHKL